MTKVLVADGDRGPRFALMYVLEDAGFEVIEAEDGPGAVELANHERPDVILMEVLLPVVDGFKVLRRLRENPATRSIPVIVVTSMPPEEGEQRTIELGVTHYLSKPCEAITIESAIKVSLRESGHVGEHHDAEKSSGVPKRRQLVRTGSPRIDQLLAGGIPLGSLTLVEGTASAGKSVLCQHMVYESLLDGHQVAYFTSTQTPLGFVGQLEGLGRDVSRFFRAGQLSVYPIEEPVPGENVDSHNDPERLIDLLTRSMESLPSHTKVVIVDDATNLISLSPEMATVGFFSRCRRLSDAGRVVVLVTRSYALDDRALNRASGSCDVHVNVRIERLGAKMVRMLEVQKLGNAPLHKDNSLSFDVVPDMGIQIVPGSRVKL